MTWSDSGMTWSDSGMNMGGGDSGMNMGGGDSGMSMGGGDSGTSMGGRDSGFTMSDSGDSAAPAAPNWLTNAGVEAYTMGSDNENRPNDWIVYPSGSLNYVSMLTGEALYDASTQAESTTEFFTANEGSASVKMWGNWSGWPNETSVYQELSGAFDNKSYELSAKAMQSSIDPILQAHTYGALTIKFFNDSYALLGIVESAQVTAGGTADSWIHLSVQGTAPAGTTKVQGVLTYWQCKDDASGGNCWDGNGAVYFDDIQLTEQ